MRGGAANIDRAYALGLKARLGGGWGGVARAMGVNEIDLRRACDPAFVDALPRRQTVTLGAALAGAKPKRRAAARAAKTAPDVRLDRIAQGLVTLRALIAATGGGRGEAASRAVMAILGGPQNAHGVGMALRSLAAHRPPLARVTRIKGNSRYPTAWAVTAQGLEAAANPDDARFTTPPPAAGARDLGEIKGGRALLGVLRSVGATPGSRGVTAGELPQAGSAYGRALYHTLEALLGLPAPPVERTRRNSCTGWRWRLTEAGMGAVS